MVENPTGEDWQNVRVQLVSGRPISFRMDLYQPLYVHRPLLELAQYAALRPRAYEGELPISPPGLTPPGISPPSPQPDSRIGGRSDANKKDDDKERRGEPMAKEKREAYGFLIEDLGVGVP